MNVFRQLSKKILSHQGRVKNIILLVTFFILLSALFFLLNQEFCWFSSCNVNSGSLVILNKSNSEIPPNFKIAFIGDQGLGENARLTLELIKNEGTDMVLHQGDFDYQDDPEAWDKMISDILGPEFPYFASIGNHDRDAWSGYQEKLQMRLNKIKGAVCIGNLGIKSSCLYKGIFFILSGVGTEGSGHDTYIKEELSKNNFTWEICSWHKNQKLMQVGSKGNEVGWSVYEECRKAGAFIATGHEHSYSRTHLMDNFETQSIASTSNTLKIENGKTFAFVSGIAGYSIREQKDNLASNDWWAAVYTTDQNANHGALFCEFNVNARQNQGRCHFKDIDGNIVDKFDLIKK